MPSERLYSSPRSQNERRNRNLPGLRNYTSTHRSSVTGAMREGFVFILMSTRYDTALSLDPFLYSVYKCMRRPGCSPAAWELSAVASLRLKSWTSLSASPAFCCNFFRVSERSGRRNPPAERNALYQPVRTGCTQAAMQGDRRPARDTTLLILGGNEALSTASAPA